MKHLFAVLRVVYALVQYVIIAAGAAVAVTYVVGFRPYVVQTGSMEPAIPVGSICVVDHRADFDDVGAGEIIAFRIGDDTMVTHRAIEVTAEGIVTKGDANNTEDTALVTAENFIGRTVYWLPGAGRFIEVFRTTRGKIALVSYAAGFILIGRLLEKTRPQTLDEK